MVAVWRGQGRWARLCFCLRMKDKRTVDMRVMSEWVQPGSRVLDLGCGRGVLLDYLKSKLNVQAVGVDQVIGGFQGDGGALNLDQVESAIKMALRSSIAKRAFELYEARGRTRGKDLDDWLEAEREIFTQAKLLSTGESKVKAAHESASKKETKPRKKSPERT